MSQKPEREPMDAELLGLHIMNNQALILRLLAEIIPTGRDRIRGVADRTARLVREDIEAREKEGRRVPAHYH